MNRSDLAIIRAQATHNAHSALAEGIAGFLTNEEWDLPQRECGHSVCGQNYIDTGETECIA